MLHRGQNVAVSVEGQHDRRMPQALTYNLWILTGCKKKRGAGVPKIIRANVLQLRPFENGLEVPALEVAEC